jgi:hypothetical protein
VSTLVVLHRGDLPAPLAVPVAEALGQV